jgi:hypothetical protein
VLGRTDKLSPVGSTVYRKESSLRRSTEPRAPR